MNRTAKTGEGMRMFVIGILTGLAVVLPLAMVLVTSAGLPSGETVSQWVWLDSAAIGSACCVAAALLLAGRRALPSFAAAVYAALLLTGGIEALWGLGQLYGFTASGHALYRLTGSFFNPGPYSGYLAVVLPVALHVYLRGSGRPVRWAAAATGLLTLCVLPAGMSRSAWLAAGVACLWVYGCHARWDRCLAMWWSRRRRWLVAGCVAGLCLLLFAGGLLYTLKPDSARGRLFLWRMSVRAAMEQPWTGHGRGNFAAAYGKAQEDYFATAHYEPWEERVAGSPEYAFNEYLQVAVEHGWLALGGCLVLLAGCLYAGTRRGEYGICGGLLALSVFAFSSYPLQIPAFCVTGTVLAAAALLAGKRWEWLCLAVAAGMWGAACLRGDRLAEQACREWTHAQALYRMGAYEAAEEDYRRLYPALREKGRFLFEYGHGLHRQGKYAAADTLLQEAAAKSCDPMILNVLGKNAWAQGDYDGAERWLWQSVHRLPGRIYPYYLLARLYADTACCRPELFEQMKHIVLTKEPKVMSTAIREMRKELEQTRPGCLPEAEDKNF